MRVVPALALVLALAAPALAATPTVVAKASKTEVSVGEPFTVEVRASGPDGAAFTFPPEAVQEAFELHAFPPESSTVAGVQRYRAAVFALGGAQVPPIPVRYRLADGTSGEAQTAAIPLRVVSLLPKEPSEQKLADIRGPIGVAIGRAFWIALAVLVALAIAATWWIVSRRRRPVAVAAAPVRTVEPDEEANRALDALVQSGRLAREEYRPFYIELTAIAKRYLERRLGAPIVEMTTLETVTHLRSTPEAVDLAPTLRDLAGAADMIKFARGAGLLEEAERHLAATRGLVTTLETRLRPAAPAASDGKAA